MNMKDELIKILPKPANQLRLAHVITATKTESNTDYAKRDKQRMIELGFDVEDIDIEGKNEERLRLLLQDKDIVSVQGGNTFYLLKQVKLSGFDRVINDFINQGKIYIGVSAGSYIACPTIEQSTWKHQDKNHFGLTNLNALNLVPFLITVHFKEEYRSIVEEGVKKTQYPVVALYDTQAVLVEDGKWRIVGEGRREFLAYMPNSTAI